MHRRSEEDFRRMVSAMRLPYLRFSITPDCNAHCDFCHNEGQRVGTRGNHAQRQRAALSLEQITYIADYWREQFDEVKFTGGEPTLIENLPEIVHVFAERDYRTSMTSNGFLLDRRLQMQLRDAGLHRINVSMPSLDAQEYASSFRGKADLNRTLQNLKDLSETYGGVAKLNFMSTDSNTPSQLVPITSLSARLQMPVSLMRLVTEQDSIADEVIGYLAATIGIAGVATQRDDFATKTHYSFLNGGIWEIDDFRTESYRNDAFGNDYCGACTKKDRCTEGPYALRVLSDGGLRPCLIRTDNQVPLGEKGYFR